MKEFVWVTPVKVRMGISVEVAVALVDNTMLDAVSSTRLIVVPAENPKSDATGSPGRRACIPETLVSVVLEATVFALKAPKLACVPAF